MTLTNTQCDCLLVDLMRAPQEVSERQLRDLSPENWDRIIERGTDHRCLSYLDWSLDHVPGVGRPDVIKAMRKRWAMRALMVLRECVLIHRLFEEHGIRYAFLKGIPLAFAYYPQSWMRPYRDIDILVEPDRLGDAYDLLLNLGGPVRYESENSEELPEEEKHLPAVWSPNKAIPVELHDKIIAPDPRMNEATRLELHKKVLSDLETVNLGAAELPAPSREMMFVHVIIHGVLNHELNNGPLFLTDIIYLLEGRAPLDKEKLDDLITSLGVENAVVFALSILPEKYHSAWAKGAALIESSPRISDAALATLLLQSGQSRSEVKLYATLDDMSYKSWFRLMLSNVFASREKMATRWAGIKGYDTPAPSNPVSLWFWFISSVGVQVLGRTKPPSGVSETTSALRSLRTALSGAPDRK